ncbi:MAG: T9SS type A sorting domain-containing protein [Balneolaceae bacterium]|nr:T9SS type A sorting domain-containing protein [Balneolaceae bacterium]
MNRFSGHLPAMLTAGAIVLVLAAGIFLDLRMSPLADEPQAGISSDDTQLSLEKSQRPKGAFNRPRYEYFFRLLRDPATNAIPPDVRVRELNYARNLPRMAELPRQGAQPAGFDWSNAGPSDVGGRTRALGIDRRNPQVLIAGGVSGGIWKSTDGGATWDLKTPDAENLSVTDLVQHPGQPDTWYYVSGEIAGNSASGNGAFYYGSGVFRSTDNGESWSRITSNTDNPTVVDDPFDIMSRVEVNPATGSLFVCSNGFGVYRAPDGQHFESQAVLGNPVSMMHCDLEVTSSGTLFAALSTEKIAEGANVPQQTGLFMSTDNGDSWTDITPSGFPQAHGRSVLAAAPSDGDILYVLTEKLESETNQGISFFRLDLNENEVSPDRAGNLPDFRSGGDGSGYMNLQGGYNMVVAVKPDDPDFVLVGATNLFRSTDGFATAPAGGYDIDNESQVNQYWIGGYAHDNSFGLYPGQHPDQHVMTFDPSNPDRMFAGTDGGVSLTQNVTASEVSWTPRNDGYITSQFYTSAMPPGENDDRLMGGTQDNGTPYFRYPGGGSRITSEDISLGDGGYAFFTLDYLYVSRQRGSIVKYTTNGSGEPLRFDCVHPSGVDREQLLFIHPYTVDPNDQNVMYFPDQNRLWRNSGVNDIDNNNPSCPGASTGWEVLHEAAAPHGYTISALEVSRSPGNVLFYAASSPEQPPLVRRLDNAKNSSSTPVDISIPGAADGAWVKDLALSPVNPGAGQVELLAVMSNYNIEGLWHSDDSGQTWEAVEGNLSGGGGETGPSLRAAAILPTDEGPVYLVATSTGLYRTHTLDGSDTVWGQEAESEIGNAVTDHLDLRVADGDVAAGTHGRGMLYGNFLGNTDAPTIAVNPGSGRPGEEVTVTASDFTFSDNAAGNEVFFNDARAEVLSSEAQELRVVVPRNVLPREESSRTASLRVTTDNQTLTTAFEVLPPRQNSLSQNFPNPFGGTTQIPLDLQQESRVTLRVYNILGQEVFAPYEGDVFQPGTYNIPIDFSDRASGTYLFHVIAEPTGGGDPFIDSRPMTLVK